MNAAMSEMAAWLAAALALGVVVLAIATWRARSLLASAAAIAAMSALAASALLLLGGGDGALALAAFGVGVAPIVLLGVVLLSARTAKSERGGLLVQGVAFLAAVGVAILIAPEFSEQAASRGRHAPAPLWLGLMIFVAAAACVALLGYGERGVLGRRETGRDV